MAHLVLDGDARNLGFETAFFAARADDFVVEERDMAELACEAAFAVVQLSVHDDADGHAAAHVEVEHVALVLRLAAGILRVAAGAGVVFEQDADAHALFEQVAQRLFAGGEVFVAAARVGIHAARHADAESQNLAAVDAAGGDEVFDVGADAFDALRPVEQFERVVVLLLDDVVLQVGDQERHVVASDVHAREIDSRVGETEDVGTASAGGLYLTQIRDDVLIDQLLHEFGDCRHADMQLFGQLRKRAFAVHRHVGDDVALDDTVLV